MNRHFRDTTNEESNEGGFPGGGHGQPLPAGHQGKPQEMMPIVDKPLIQYAVEEAVAAGVTDLVFITGRPTRDRGSFRQGLRA